MEGILDSTAFIRSRPARAIGTQWRSAGARRRAAALRGRTLAAALLLFAVLVAQVSVRVAIIRSGYTLEDLRERGLELDQHSRQYRLYYAWLASPQRLSKKAQEDLRMAPVRPQQIRRL